MISTTTNGTRAETINATESVVDPMACTLAANAPYGTSINLQAFQQDVLITANGKQYVAYYDAGRRVCVGRRDISSTKPGEWQIVRLSDSTLRNGLKDRGRNPKDAPGWDAHNTISMGIALSDGTIHLAFDHHDDALRYRRSVPGVASAGSAIEWSDKVFLPETDHLGDKKIDAFTYPQFTQAPGGNLLLTFRIGHSGGGELKLATYDAASHQWSPQTLFITAKGQFKDFRGVSDQRNAYTNGPRFDREGKLHIVWVWREALQGANHDICYLSSIDAGKTWQTADGKNAGDLNANHPIDLNTPGIVAVAIDRKQSLMNQPDLCIDSKGRPHALIWHRIKGQGEQLPWDRKNSAYFHYYLDQPGEWKQSRLPASVGTRPRIAFDSADNAYAVFIGGSTDNQGKPGLYPSGSLEVYRASADNGYADWKSIHIGSGNFIGDPAIDPILLLQNGVLSIAVQESPATSEQSTPLRVIDLKVK